MPAPPRFRSELTRRMAVAAAMGVLLAVSLGIAAVVSVARGPEPIGTGQVTHIGDVELTIPEGWTSIYAPITTVGVIEDRVQYSRDDRPMEKLWIAALPEAPVRSSLYAIERAKSFVTQQTRLQFQFSGSTPFRHGLITGRQVTTITDPHRQPFEHHLAIFTVTGRQYWLVYFTAPITNDQLMTGRVLQNAQTIQQICLSAKYHRLHAAGEDDFAAADLPNITGLDAAGFFARVDHLRRPNAPIIVIPNTHVQALAVLRVRGTLNVSAPPKGQPLSPADLLAEAYRRYAGNSPDDLSVYLDDRDAAHPIWSVHFDPSQVLRSVSNPAWSLWYAPISPYRGILIEGFYEHNFTPEAGAWAKQLVSLAAKAEDKRLETADIAPPTTIDELRVRGTRLAESVRDGQQAVAERKFQYTMLWNEQRVVGVGMTELYPPSEDLPHIIEGIKKTVQTLPVKAEIDIRWKRSLVDHSFRIAAYQSQIDAQTNQPAVRRYDIERQGDRLVCVSTVAGQAVTSFAVNVDASYISPLDMDHWSGSALASLDEGPAVALVATAFEVPQPHVVQRIKNPGAGTDENSLQPDQSVVQIRPIMAMEPQTLVFDSQGDLIRLQQYVLLGNGRGGVYQQLARAPRSAIVRQFPQLDEMLTAWEQQHATDDETQTSP